MDTRSGGTQVAVERAPGEVVVLRRPVAAPPRAVPVRRRTRSRGLVIGVLAVLVGAVAFQGLRTRDLERQLVREQARVANLASGLRSLQGQVLPRGEIDLLRTEMIRGLADTGERVRALEAGATAVAKVVARASASVALVQGSYGLRDPATKRLLRFAVQGGRPIRMPDGRPQFTLDGDGPPFEVRFNGTAFVVDHSGVLLTNRHVALPWEGEMSLHAIRKLGLEPTLLGMRGYLSGASEPFDVKLLGASDTHDLALLQGEGAARQAPPLRLSGEPPSPGDEAILLGFPAGVRALLARADDAFAKDLRNRSDLDEDVVVRELARTGVVKPLASRGIVAQVAGEAIVHDAQTHSGGSGGPVLNLKGDVIAINRATLAGFGGSNIGVPARHAAELMSSVQPKR